MDSVIALSAEKCFDNCWQFRLDLRGKITTAVIFLNQTTCLSFYTMKIAFILLMPMIVYGHQDSTVSLSWMRKTGYHGLLQKLWLDLSSSLSHQHIYTTLTQILNTKHNTNTKHKT